MLNKYHCPCINGCDFLTTLFSSQYPASAKGPIVGNHHVRTPIYKSATEGVCCEVLDAFREEYEYPEDSEGKKADCAVLLMIDRDKMQ